MSDWQVRGFTEIRELGRGGQGRVVLARHAQAGTPVAIKYLPADADPASKERFRHEAQMLGRVDHPHVARLYRLVENSSGMAIVMEAVNGVPLTKILEVHGALEPEAALIVLKGSLLGLAAAHQVGVVHRDYKPANVIVRGDGVSKLIDFGVAVYTGQGSFAGTPHYMAPEQWRSEPASPATDVYAATCVFYECVTGQRPFGSGDRAAIRARHLNAPVPTDDIPEKLRPLITRGMAKDPAERPGSANAFVEELEQVAVDTYGIDWESKGIRALATGAAAFTALFPLTAAGITTTGGAATATTAAAGAATGTGGSSAIMGALTSKAGLAVAGAAVATAAVGGGVTAHQVLRPDPVERSVAAVTASPTPSGKRLDLGDFTITAPASWRVGRLNNKPGGYEIRLPGRCTSTQPFGNLCPNVKVLGRPFIEVPEDSILVAYRRNQAWHPNTDPTHNCPARPSLPIALGTRMVKQSTAKVGDRTAEYREWRMQCSDANGTPQNVFFVQRLWYLPSSQIVIVDEWDTPNLAQILARARWTA